MNTILRITFLLITIFSLKLGAQCPTGDVVFKSQADVDNFKAQWPNCTELDNNLTIRQEAAEIYTTGLEYIVEISGRLIIHHVNENIHLSGLQNLKRVGSIYLERANTDLSFLANLNTISGDFIDVGSSLLNLDIFQNLNYIEGIVCTNLQSISATKISDISALSNINGLNKIIFRGDISNFNNIDSLDHLEALHITGLNNLKYVKNFVSSGKSYPGLQNLNQVDNLSFFGEVTSFPSSVIKIQKITLGSNSYPEFKLVMNDFNLFENVNRIDTIQVENTTLQSFEGLEHLTSIGSILVNEHIRVSFSGLNNLEIIEGTLETSLFDTVNLIILPSLTMAHTISIVKSWKLVEIQFPKLTSINNLSINGWTANTVKAKIKFPKLASINNSLHLSGFEVSNYDFFRNLESIGGSLYLDDILTDQDVFPKLQNTGSLTLTKTNDISGFNSLKSIHGELNITGFEGYATISGFNELTKIDADFSIGSRNIFPEKLYLDTLQGFEKLEEIGGTLDIGLTSINSIPFHSLNIIGNKTIVRKCPNLESLEGLNNLISTKHLIIEDNENLFDCSALCNLFQADGVQGIIEFNHNPSTCSSQSAIESECEDPDGFMLRTQAQVDDFIANYSNTETISGDLIIGDNEAPFTTSDITDISGMSFLTTIIGDLYIGFNNSLENLNGLDNLTAITGNVTIRNNDMLSDLRDNKVVTVGFEKISQIGGDLQILENNALASLNGLENLSTVSGKLVISTNPNLSDCKGICNILENDGVQGSIIIIGNPSGCSNQADVDQSCMVGSSDLLDANQILLSPNPTENILNVSSIDNLTISEIIILDQFGKELIHTSKSKINVTMLSDGIYFVKVKIGNQFAFRKFLKF